MLLASTEPCKTFVINESAVNKSISHNQRVKFVVQTVDKNGFRRHKGADLLSVFGVNEALGITTSPNKVDIFDNQDGTYEVSVKPEVGGSYLIHILVNGQPIMSSPLIVEVEGGNIHPENSFVTVSEVKPMVSYKPSKINAMCGDALIL